MSLPENNVGYPYNFTTQKRQKIEGYLAWKWGIQDDLSDTHPYKYNQPTTTINPQAVASVVADSPPTKPVDLVVGASPTKVISLHVTNTAPDSVTNLNVSKADLITTLSSGVDLEMNWVEPGTFMMGQSIDSNTNSYPAHQVTLTQGFYLGKYEVTQAQYEVVMTGNTDGFSATPSSPQNSPNRPVNRITYESTQVFLTLLNEQQSENLPNGWAYVLPTEAQWEYACRAGTTTAYSWGNSITSSDANYDYNIGQTTDVGQYSPNAWGFYDMHGNAYEIGADTHRTYTTDPQTDPFTDAGSAWARKVRGGTFTSVAGGLTVYKRVQVGPTDTNSELGFRVALKQIIPVSVSSIEVTVS